MSSTPTLHVAAGLGHLPIVKILAESWPLDQRPWKMFLMGSGAASELRDYLAPPANRATRNFLPILYKPEMMKEVWKFLHKPRYVDLDKRDGEGREAVTFAMQKGKVEVVALLLHLSAQAMPGGNTALHLACQKGYRGVAELLLDQGAVVGQATKDGYTALMSACLGGHRDVAELLLDRGADVAQAIQDRSEEHTSELQSQG